MSKNGRTRASTAGHREWWKRYGVAAIAVFDAFATFIAFPGIFQASGSPQLLLSLSVLVAAWYGGLGPGLVARAVIVLFIWPADLSTPNVMRLLIFIAQCLVCSAGHGVASSLAQASALGGGHAASE